MSELQPDADSSLTPPRRRPYHYDSASGVPAITVVAAGGGVDDGAATVFEPENHQHVVREARRIVQGEQAAKAQAAQRIQSCWREYRDAVAHLERLTVDEDGGPMLLFSDEDDDEDVMQHRDRGTESDADRGGTGSDERSPTSVPPSHIHSAFAGHTRRSRAASQASISSSHSLGSSASDLHSIIQSILTTAGDLDDEFASRNDMIREYAATLIQRTVRRSLLVPPALPDPNPLAPEAMTGDDVCGASSPPSAAATLSAMREHDVVRSIGGGGGGGDAAELPDTALQALRILQNRFRFQRFRRMIEEREQNELIRRLQQLWRRRKNLKRHFEALHSGREDVAARDIQRAYLRHRELRQHQQQQEQLLKQQQQGGLYPPVTLLGDHVIAGPLAPPAAVAVPSDDASLVEQQQQQSSRRPLSSTLQNHHHHHPLPHPSQLPQCIICMSHVVQIAFLPCGHAHTCVPCAARCLRCPSCRRMVALQIRIYL